MPRKKAVQVPGEPAAKAETTAAETQEQNQDAPEVEQASVTSASDLPDASDIDPKKISRAVLTKQGWVCPG